MGSSGAACRALSSPSGLLRTSLQRNSSIPFRCPPPLSPSWVGVTAWWMSLPSEVASILQQPGQQSMALGNVYARDGVSAAHLCVAAHVGMDNVVTSTGLPVVQLTSTVDCRMEAIDVGASSGHPGAPRAASHRGGFLGGGGCAEQSDGGKRFFRSSGDLAEGVGRRHVAQPDCPPARLALAASGAGGLGGGGAGAGGVHSQEQKDASMGDLGS